MAIKENESKTKRLARKSKRHRGRRDEILIAAREVMGKQGAEGLTVTAVAKEADISTPSLYYYFKSKEAIAEALAVTLLEEEVECIFAAIEKAKTPIDAVIAAVISKMEYYRKQPESFHLLYEGTANTGISKDTLQNSVYPLSARIGSALEKKLIEGQEAGNIHPEVQPRKLANVVWFMTHGFLSAGLNMEKIGGSLKFDLMDLTEEACATLRRACSTNLNKEEN